MTAQTDTRALTALRDAINEGVEWATTTEMLERWAVHHEENRRHTTAGLLREYATVLSALIAQSAGEGA